MLENFFERFTKHCTKLPRLNNLLELGFGKNIVLKEKEK